jgi:hypothetical protein
LLGILFCIATLLFAYAAYMNTQSRHVDEWIIIQLVIGAIEPFIAVLLLIEDRYFKYTSVQFIARIIGVFCIVIGIILAIYFLSFTIIGNDYSRSWSLSVIMGLLSIIQFFAYFIINRRVRQILKDNETYKNSP